jgi:hypothetical protein
MSFRLLLLVGAFIGGLPQAAAKPPCETSPLIRATPPPDPGADPFGEGPWYINADRISGPMPAGGSSDGTKCCGYDRLEPS